MDIIKIIKRGCCFLMIVGLLYMFATGVLFNSDSQYYLLNLLIGAAIAFVGGACAIWITPCCGRSEREQRLITHSDENQHHVSPEAPTSLASKSASVSSSVTHVLPSQTDNMSPSVRVLVSPV